MTRLEEMIEESMKDLRCKDNNFVAFTKDDVIDQLLSYLDHCGIEDYQISQNDMDKIVANICEYLKKFDFEDLMFKAFENVSLDIDR